MAYINCVLIDQDPDDSKAKPPLNVKVHNEGSRILVQPEGYGDHCSQDGEGAPILIESIRGKLRIVAWADINKEDPTDTVGMEEARESNRADEDA